MRSLFFPRDVVIFGCLLTVTYAGELYAYLDPGTGSYFFQILIGVLLGSLLAIKLFWRNIIAFIQRMFSSKGSSKKDD